MATGTGLILLVAGILGLGVLAQLLAARLQVPSIIFYLAAGVALGPEGLAVLTNETFGNALPAIVGLAVAIIVFEGAFHLRVDRLREAPAATLRLVTIGAAIALGGTALAVRLAFGADWNISFLIGALLVATGPTVIAPILQVVPVRDRVATALDTEGIVNDVTAAIMAVVVFESINPEIASGNFVSAFASRLGIGVVVGALVAALVFYTLSYVDLSADDAPRNARLMVLTGALVAYAGAEGLAPEAGVAAAATAGVLLGNADIPYEADITDFKGDITLLVLSFVFIALAAQLRLDTLEAVGLPGLAVVAAIILIIRPALVFLTTLGGRFTNSERLFMSAVGPRGIIPASIATLFAVELESAAGDLSAEAAGASGAEAARLTAQAATLSSQADLLVGVVFLTIFVTVVLQGGLARYVAEYLNVIPMRVIIVGGGTVGRALAERLEDRGENVVIIESDESIVEKTRNEGFTVEWGDGTDTEVLRSAGAANAKVVVAATGDDDSNLLVSQLAASKFDVEQVYARANNPDNVDAFEELGVRTIDSGMATAWAIDNQIERPAIANWMTNVGRMGDVQEVEVTSEEVAGTTVRELGPQLPDACLIALLTREGETMVPTADTEIELGDTVTLLGQRDSVRDGMAFCNP